MYIYIFKYLPLLDFSYSSTKWDTQGSLCPPCWSVQQNLDAGTSPRLSQHWSWSWSNDMGRGRKFPPTVVLDSAIVGTNASKSIFLPINFRERYQVSAYFVLYFDVSNVHQFVEETTTLGIFIDGQLVNYITQIRNTPSNEGQAVVSICPVNVTGGMANLTISPAEGITSPAFLNVLEVYSLMGISKAAQSTNLFAFQTFFGLVLFFLCVVLWIWIPNLKKVIFLLQHLFHFEFLLLKMNVETL